MKTDTLFAKDFYTTDLPAQETTKTSFSIPSPQVTIPLTPASNPKELALLVATFVALIAGAVGAYAILPELELWHAQRITTTVGYLLAVVGSALLIYQGALFSYFIYLYTQYRPIESVSDEELPTVTVIVPAYNEGKLVYDTLISLANSDYPAAKMQLLAVDDGSKDDTWSWIQLAKHKLGDRVTIFQQPVNKGKRHALYRGFNIGTGEVFVTVDSDSVVNPDTLRNLVSPMAVDNECGAVAGNVAVLNQKGGIFPKMLNVSFVMSFEFRRSAESVLNSVLCTPGALAAYRREAVFACLDAWINQTFNGKPSDIGEDRALTNMILKQGKKVLFQRNAYVYTNVPETYKGLYKMFIRWGRSNVREHLMMAKYVFTDFRKGNKFGTRLLFIDASIRMVLLFPLLAATLFFVVSQPLAFLTTSLASILVLATFSVGFFAHKYTLSKALWGYTYSLLFTFGLFWITPYAMITASKGGWLTRELPQKAN